MAQNSPEKEYVLGTHDEELARLGFQHQLWRAPAYALWERAGFTIGHRLLDVGCGPGFTTLDLAGWVGPNGRVDARDISHKFIGCLRQMAAARGIENIHAAVEDVQAMQLPASTFDGAYTRWVLCFVPDPDAVIARVAAALRPGAAFAIQDYYHYEAISLSPPSAAFRRVVAATAKSWREHGGDAEIGARLPALLHRHGLQVTEVRPLTRAARSTEMLWAWPTTFFRIFIPSLIKLGHLTEADREAFDADWAERSRDPSAWFISPPMLDIIAVKRQRPAS